MPKLDTNPAVRLKAYSMQDKSGCWIWQRHVNSGGYGTVSYLGRKMLAHRASYEEFVGPIPDGLTLDHLCRNTRCVNPEHLEPVTNRENILRGDGLSARRARVTVCPKGHPYDDKNTYRTPDGRRNCRACNRLRARALAEIEKLGGRPW